VDAAWLQRGDGFEIGAPLRAQLATVFGQVLLCVASRLAG